MTELDAFPLFPHLPIELQSMVWDWAFYLRPTHTAYVIYSEGRPAVPPEPGVYVNFPIFPEALGQRSDPRRMAGGSSVINGLDLPQGTLRLEGGWAEGGDEQERWIRRVLVFPHTGLPGLLHATRESRRGVLRALKTWLDGLLAELGVPTIVGGKPRFVHPGETREIKVRGQNVANVVQHLLCN